MPSASVVRRGSCCCPHWLAVPIVVRTRCGTGCSHSLHLLLKLCFIVAHIMHSVLKLVTPKSRFIGIDLPVWGRTAVENTNPDMHEGFQWLGVVVVPARRVGGRNCDVAGRWKGEEPAAVSAQ